MTKYILIALALVALLAGGWGAYEHQRAEKQTLAAKVQKDRADGLASALATANSQAALLREASLARQQELNRLRKDAAQQKEKLDAALKANRDWADAPIPDGVLSALGAASGTAGQAGPGVDRARAGTSAPRP